MYVSKAMVVAEYRTKLRALSAHCDVHLVVPDRWGRVAYEEGDDGSLPVCRTRTLLHGHNHLHVYPAARRMLSASAPDLVHIDEEPYSAVTFQLARACAAAKVPCIFFAWQNLSKRMPQPFRTMRGYVFAHAHGAIAGTVQAAAVLQEAGCALPRAVIPQMGVDTERFAPDASARAEVRRRFGVPERAFMAGFAGRLVPEKGVHLLIDALAPLADAQLLVIGDGPERRRLELQAAALMPDRVVFVGRIGSMDMPSLLRTLDVLVLPSLRTAGWTEQFGRVLIEAMACGVPVIGSTSGEIPHVIADAGRIVPAGDRAALQRALARLASSPVQRALLGERGRLLVQERYTHDRIAADTMAFYRTVLEAA